MTLLIAILLMQHMGIENLGAYFGVVVLWFLHLVFK